MTIEIIDHWASLDPLLAFRQLTNAVTLYKLVNVTTAEMLTNGSSPIVLLPALGPGKMYLITSAIAYYIAGSVPFDGPGAPFLYYGDPKNNIGAVPGQFIWNGFASGSQIYAAGTGAQEGADPASFLNQPIVMTDGQDYTQGDGSAKIALSYMVADFS